MFNRATHPPRGAPLHAHHVKMWQSLLGGKHFIRNIMFGGLGLELIILGTLSLYLSVLLHAQHYSMLTNFGSVSTAYLIFEVYVVLHSSPEVLAQFPILCMYLMGSNWSSAYRSASRGKLL